MPCCAEAIDRHLDAIAAHIVVVMQSATPAVLMPAGPFPEIAGVAEVISP
jgi:hypothetical protein